MSEYEVLHASFMNQLDILERDIVKVLKATGYMDPSGLVNGEVLYQDIDTDSCTPDKVQEWRAYSEAFYKLTAVLSSIHYLRLPVLTEGRISRNGRGGRLTVNDVELPCGSVVDILIPSGTRAGKEWARTSIEADGAGFYFTNYPNEEVIGHIARVRG